MISDSQKIIILEKLRSLEPLKIFIFGSYARNEQNSSSDLDILIDTHSKFSLLDLIGVEQELTDLLGIKVDLVTRRSLSKHFKPLIEKDLLPLL